MQETSVTKAILGIGVIGAGYISEVHLRQILRLYPQAKLIALCDTDSLRAKELGHAFGIEQVTDSYREVIENPNVDVIHNCTPNHLHYSINKEALQAGKHLLSEKPLATTWEEASELTALAKELGLEAGVNFCYRYYPVVQEAAAKSRRGDLGEVRMLTGSYFQDHLSREDDYNWRLNPDLSGPSAMMADLGSHWLDLVEFVGNHRIVEVFADFHTAFPVRKQGTQSVSCPLEDIATLLLRLDNGARGSFITSQMAVGKRCTIDLQIYGSEQSIAWNHERSAELWIGHRDQANQTLIESPLLQSEESRRYAVLPSGHVMGYHDAMFNLFQDFYHAVQRNRDVAYVGEGYPTFNDATKQLSILESIIRSAQTGHWITVNQQLAAVAH
ncbi:MAG: dehydrogenase [Waddliaceae bacterium]|nr:dehydrogenase [Waddliaceae bacterium]